MKSLWFTVYPIVSLTRKDRISSDSAFCQASGFFLALGIESSDVAVLLIAIHSALYFVYPRRAGGGKGLYPYRHFAYAFYVFVPIIMASLAFVKGTPGYVDTGEYCYLPTHPSWYRMALSWIPRYVNFVILIVIYSCIYLYVRLLMRRYSRRSSSAMVTTADNDDSQVPRSQTLNRHDLIPKPPHSSGSRGRKLHCSCRTILLTKVVFKRGKEHLDAHTDNKAISWKVPNFQQTSNPGSQRQLDAAPENIYLVSPHIEPLDPIYPKRHPSRVSLDSDIQPESFGTSLRDIFRPSRRGTSQVVEHEDGCFSCTALPFSNDVLDPDGIVRNRDKIRRQLRLLFMYPLVYMLVWVLPFISDIKRYQDALNGRGPFGLRLAFLISLCIQGFADSIVFAFRERPWRYARGGFWTNIGLRMRFNVSIGRRRNPGRTRDEMFDEARIARQRRDDEAQHERVLRQTTGGASLRQGGKRNWWDREPRDSSDWSDDEDETGMVDWGNGLKGSGIPAERLI